MEHDLEFFRHLSWERCGRWYQGNTPEGGVEACKSRKSTRDKCQWVLHFGETALPKHKHWVHSKEDIAELTSFLDTKWSNLKPVPGTHQVHCVKSHGSDSVQVSDTTDGGEARVCVICTTTTTQEEQGEQDKQEDEDEEEEEQEDEDEEEDEQEDEDKEEDEQEDEDEEEEDKARGGRGNRHSSWTVGCGTVRWNRVSGRSEVNRFQHWCSSECNAQKWKLLEMAPSRDMIYYKKSDILCIVSTPIAAGHRGQFTFSDYF